MEALFEIVLGFLFELFLQILGEVLCEMGSRRVADALQRRPVKNPFLAGIGYFTLGAILGGLSLLIASHSLLHDPTWRLLNLFFTPVLAGFAMTLLGLFRRRKGQELVRLDRFWYGFIFAFGMALVRFLYASK